MNRLTRFLAALGATLAMAVSPGAFAAGTITMLDSFDVIDWDPAIYYSAEPRVMLNIYETLTYYNPETGTAEPRLATSWSVSDDGLVWTFNLREGVEFHDGSDWNAAAAKANLDRVREMGKGAAYIWDSVSEITATDDHTLTITTSYPAPLNLIASAQYAATMASPPPWRRARSGSWKATRWVPDRTGSCNGKSPNKWCWRSSMVTTRANYRQRVRRELFEWPPEDCIPGSPWTGDSWRFGNRLRRTFGCGSIRRLSA